MSSDIEQRVALVQKMMQEKKAAAAAAAATAAATSAAAASPPTRSSVQPQKMDDMGDMGDTVGCAYALRGCVWLGPDPMVHIAQCNFAPATCTWCPHRCSRGEKNAHEAGCVNRKQTCEQCRTGLFTMQELKVHEANECAHRARSCEHKGCTWTGKVLSYDAHLKSDDSKGCQHVTIPCKYAGCFVRLPRHAMISTHWNDPCHLVQLHAILRMMDPNHVDRARCHLGYLDPVTETPAMNFLITQVKQKNTDAKTQKVALQKLKTLYPLPVDPRCVVHDWEEHAGGVVLPRRYVDPRLQCHTCKGTLKAERCDRQVANILQTVRSVKRTDLNACIACIMHANFETALFPLLKIVHYIVVYHVQFV